MSVKYDYIKFFRDYGIPFDAEIAQGRGFIAFPCPYCRGESHKNTSYYGAIHNQYNYFRCWKCGKKPLKEVFYLLTGQNWEEISQNYKADYDIRDIYILKNTEETRKSPPALLSLPSEARELGDREKAYLESRGFEPEAIIKRYGLVSTGFTGEYKFRIIIPIYWGGRLVSYQGRDYTGLSNLRYKACSKEKEIIHHKHILYGGENTQGEHIICVEGIIDKWKMGEKAVATFGTGYTKQQLVLLSRYKKVSVLFDGEPEANKHAENLANSLAGLNVDVEIVYLKSGDPGDLSIEEAGELAREILEK